MPVEWASILSSITRHSRYNDDQATTRPCTSERSSLKHLLVVYHSQSGNTEALSKAIVDGARDAEISNVDVRYLRAVDAGPDDLLWAQALILGTPENFGYLSGGMKDFLDRTFYPVEGKLQPLPYALFISAGNDGSGAVRALRRIAPGYPLVEVQEPLIVVGAPESDGLARCRELGMTMAAGLEVGAF